MNPSRWYTFFKQRGKGSVFLCSQQVWKTGCFELQYLTLPCTLANISNFRRGRFRWAVGWFWSVLLGPMMAGTPHLLSPSMVLVGSCGSRASLVQGASKKKISHRHTKTKQRKGLKVQTEPLTTAAQEAGWGSGAAAAPGCCCPQPRPGGLQTQPWLLFSSVRSGSFHHGWLQSLSSHGQISLGFLSDLYT